MKKFNFSLKALLKLREFKEEACKAELGKIISQIQANKNSIGSIYQSIESAQAEHNEKLREGLEAREASFFPYYIEGRKKHIEKIEQEIIDLEEKRIEATNRLAILRGETKVIEKLEEKEIAKYKEEYNRHQALVLEEGVQLWLLNQKKSS